MCKCACLIARVDMHLDTCLRTRLGLHLSHGTLVPVQRLRMQIWHMSRNIADNSECQVEVSLRLCACSNGCAPCGGAIDLVAQSY